MNPVQELSGTTVTANMLTGLGVDEYFTRTDSTGTSDFLDNALGSTIALADTTGAVQTQYTYSPFGGTTVQGAANANSYQFTGRENDGQGLYYYRARYYDPMLSRFISQDPSGLPGADANLYAYVWSSPADFIDPFGRWGFGVQGGVSAGAGAGAGVVGGASGGVGVFGGNGVSAGAYGTAGAFAGAGPYNLRYPNSPGTTGYVAGYGADVRAGAFFTNATSVQQLSGPFRSFTIGAGVLFGGEVEVAWSNGTWIVSTSGTLSPLPWPSAMISLMNTMTYVHCFGKF